MKLCRIILFVICLSLCGAVSAQSGKGAPVPVGKANQRPTPTPTPAAEVLAANNNSASLDDSDVIKVNTQLVSMPVKVMDKTGRFVAGLKKENFKVSEDGVDQEISLFSNEHEPFTVALLLDMSYSTKFKIADIQYAAITFIDQLRPQDKVMVISFDGDVHVLSEATSDRQELYKAIRSTRILPGTSLYEAVDLVINDRMRKITGRKAIILFTDGVDTTSQRITEANNLSDALELDSLIYPIRYDTFEDVQAMKNRPVGSPPPITSPVPKEGESTLSRILGGMGGGVGTPSDRGTTAEDYRRAENYLEQLALRTGGREYLANSVENLSDAFSRIASELREFYSIGYYPTSERVAGKKTNVKVRVDQPGSVVRAREGFLMRRRTK